MVKTTEEFLAEYPDATLKDYVNYKKETEFTENELELKKTEQYNKWFINNDGHYFVINHNNTSYEVVKLNINPLAVAEYLMYKRISCNVYKYFNDGFTLSISKEDNTTINPDWLYNYNTHKPEYVVEAYEISEEKYKKITEKFDKYIDLTQKDIKL